MSAEPDIKAGELEQRVGLYDQQIEALLGRVATDATRLRKLEQALEGIATAFERHDYRGMVAAIDRARGVLLEAAATVAEGTR